MTDRKLVHIVDDEEEVCRSTAYMMGSVGFKCCYWTSAIAFLEGADLTRHDCVILDLRMPEMDGLAVQQELAERKSRIQVIMVSGHGDASSRQKAIQAGALDFVEKPYDLDNLTSKVIQALGAGH